MSRVVVLAIALCGSPAGILAAAPGPGADATSFVSACRTRAEDPEFASDVVLALVHEVGKASTILFRITGQRVEPLAELHHATADNSEFLEAQGGVESTAVASDVVAFLRHRPFSLVRNWKSTILDARGLSRCQIKYVETDRYRASHVRRKE